jgi:hypothetical protein
MDAIGTQDTRYYLGKHATAKAAIVAYNYTRSFSLLQEPLGLRLCNAGYVISRKVLCDNCPPSVGTEFYFVWSHVSILKCCEDYKY